MDITDHIQQILQRYADKGAFHAINGYEDLQRAGIQGDLVLALLDLFEDPSSFSEDKFQDFPIPVIMDYIQRTHQFYLSKKLPEIEQSIHLLLENYSGGHPLLTVLTQFYQSYKHDLVEHIALEEKQLIPYIQYLCQTDKPVSDIYTFYKKTQSYSLQHFLESHHDMEQDLTQVRGTMLKCRPPVTNQTPYRILLSQLETFEKDLAVHSMVEDRILLPRALGLEQSFMDDLKYRAGSN
ncbi:MAG: hemerythrin domain-containing protein [Bacteroidetes bacterium]|nr:hemerythrin domain-containing protein [Bacteroidota bacterium]